MKKELYLIISIILIIFIITLVVAQSNELDNNKIIQNSRLAKDKIDELKDQTNKDDFLKQEWFKLLNQNKFFGPVVRTGDKALEIINPISKILLKTEAKFSWIFLLTVIIFSMIITYTKRILDIFSPFSNTTTWVISIGFSIILSYFGTSITITNILVNLVSLTQKWWIQLIVIILVVFLFLIFLIFSKRITKAVKIMKIKNKEKKNREELETETKIAKSFTDEITK